MDGPLLSESEKRSFEFVWMVMNSTAENLFAAKGKSPSCKVNLTLMFNLL